MSQPTRPQAGLLSAAVLISLCLLVATTSAGTERRYVKTKQGDRPMPIVAIDNVCAWPNLTVLGDGTIIATIFNRPSHGKSAGDVDCWASKNGGRSWRRRGTPAPHEPDATRMNVAAGRAKNGDLIVISSGWSNKYPPEKKGPPFRAGILESWVCRSSDGGSQWSIDKRAFPSRGPRGGDCIPFGDIVRGNDGTLRVAIYEVIDLRDDRVWLFRSRDDGRTWGEPVVLDENAYRNETALLHLGGGRWLAAIRENGLHLHASADDGKTWEHRMRLTGPDQHPGHLLRLRSGRILLAYGNRTPNAKGVDVRWTDDEGKTWSASVRVLDFQGDGGYPSSVQLPDGQVVTAYYARKIESHDRYHMGVVIWDPVRTLPKVIAAKSESARKRKKIGRIPLLDVPATAQ